MARLARIEKGVKIPPRMTGPRNKYPWETIQPGDSFKVHTTKKSTIRGIYFCAANKGMKVAMRRENGGYRVWRVDGLSTKKRKGK
jgi:hypothetical protein